MPSTYKLSNTIPVPKSSSAELLNNFRPVVLTPCVMNFVEKIVLKFINTILPPDFNVSQFAYQEKRSVEDALSINCHEVLDHPERLNSYIRIISLITAQHLIQVSPKNYMTNYWLILNFLLHCVTGS